MRDRLFRSLVLFLMLKEQNWTEPKISLTWLYIYLCVELPQHRLKAEEYFQNSGCKWRPHLKPGPLSLETSTKDLYFYLFFFYNQQDNYHKSIYLPSSPLFLLSALAYKPCYFNFFPVLPVLLEHFIFNSQLIWRSATLKFNRVQC